METYICKYCGITFIKNYTLLLLCNKCKIKNKTIKRIAYRNTIDGKLIISKNIDKRKRELGSEIINDWFEGCHRHHINKQQIICIPKYLHNKYRHNHNKPNTMIIINRIAFLYLTNTVKQL